MTTNQNRTEDKGPLFMGVFPTGISYADRRREAHEDYCEPPATSGLAARENNGLRAGLANNLWTKRQ